MWERAWVWGGALGLGKILDLEGFTLDMGVPGHWGCWTPDVAGETLSVEGRNLDLGVVP